MSLFRVETSKTIQTIDEFLEQQKEVRQDKEKEEEKLNDDK